MTKTTLLALLFAIATLLAIKSPASYLLEVATKDQSHPFHPFVSEQSIT